MDSELFTFLPDLEDLKRLDLGFGPRSQRSFPRDVKKIYRQRCFITGLKKDTEIFLGGDKSVVKLDVHHLESRALRPDLAFCLLNGIVLEKSLHKRFHKEYGLLTSFEQFKDYILKYNLYFPESPIDSYKLSLLVTWVDLLEKSIKNI